MGRSSLILLDTVTLIWFTMGDERLGSRSRNLINTDDRLYISAITPWEVAMLVGKGRVNFDRHPLAWVERILSNPRVTLAAIDPRLAVEAGLLPRSIHGDPADRLLIATAKALSCSILTPDSKLLGYAQEGHLQAIDARL